jgi:pimeloyl-ACP methyl ester carboxylesterase
MEWGSTVRYIAKKRSFHFLLPSLQAHQISDLDYCIELLATCIHFEAKSVAAHVVGLSIGTHIAILLAARYLHLT